MSERINYEEVIESRRYPERETLSTLRFFAVLLAVFAAFIFVFTHVLIGVQVSGSSMEPTLYGGKPNGDGTYSGGDYLFVNTLDRIDYGDIIVFHATPDISDNSELIKRVIGLPGDSVYAVNGVLYRIRAGSSSPEIVEEPYLGEAWTETFPSAGDTRDYVHDGKVVVPEGMVFVLGDHRSVSKDSRSFGPIPLDNVVGVVTGWSLKHRKSLATIFGFFGFIREIF